MCGWRCSSRCRAGAGGGREKAGGRSQPLPRERGLRESPGRPFLPPFPPRSLCRCPPGSLSPRSHGKRRRWQHARVAAGPAVTLPRAAIEGRERGSPARRGRRSLSRGRGCPCREPGSGRGAASGETLIQFGFFSYFPLLSPALSLLCQLSEMLCLTGSLSQISYHLKPLGRERWRPRKGSKWVYQCFFTPRELLDTKGKGIKDLKRAQKRESSL